MKTRREHVRAVALALIGALCCVWSRAQEGTVALKNGQISDDTGVPIAGSKVQPHDAGTLPQAYVDPFTVILPVVDAKDIHFTRLSTDEGLSQTRVIQIVQDDQGFMWFGSQYGLNRYDGYKFP